HLARTAGVKHGIDLDGKQSLAGTANYLVASMAIRNWENVFQPPPKSADIPEMIAAFEKSCDTFNPSGMSLSDQLATACEMAGLGLGFALTHLPARPDEIIASG